jgi:NADH-quinone oxidoreductase subunit J
MRSGVSNHQPGPPNPEPESAIPARFLQHDFSSPKPFSVRRLLIMSLFFFAILALMALLSALGVILSKNAVYSALWLLVHFLTIAVLYFALSAQFLGVVQVIVYAGAIVVLFLFVIMLIGGTITPIVHETRPYARVAAALLGAVFLVGLLLGLGRSLSAFPQPVGAPDAGSVQAVAEPLYTTYLIPFELASLLLLAGMLGGIVLAMKERKRS